ncbi:MAG: hypothetical protein GXP42_10145 [Chloroflexi bacterium]|nr:hypothetical protein [Chloroflexota bacterium]
MTALIDSFNLLQRGLFLEPNAYDEAADAENGFVEGLFLVLIIGLAVAAAAFVGGILKWGVTPDLAQLESTVLNGLQAMPWFQELMRDPQAAEIFRQQWDMGWRIAGFFWPRPVQWFGALILTPLGLIMGWLWFAVIAHLVAKALGGEGGFGQTLAATALASAPALLHILGFIPYITIAGVGTWMLLTRYVALRRVHENLTWPRVLIALFAPSIALALFAFAFSMLAFFLLFSVVSASM